MASFDLANLPTDALSLILRQLRPSDIIVLRFTCKSFTTLPMLSDELIPARSGRPKWKIPRYLHEEQLLAQRRFEFDYYLRAKVKALSIVKVEEAKLRVQWEEEERKWKVEYDRIKAENDILEAEQERLRLEEEEKTAETERLANSLEKTHLDTHSFSSFDAPAFNSSSPPTSFYLDDLSDADFFAAESAGVDIYSDFSPTGASHETYDSYGGDITPPSSPPASSFLHYPETMPDTEPPEPATQPLQSLPPPPPPPRKLNFLIYIDVSASTAGLNHLICNKCGHIFPVSHPSGLPDGISNIGTNTIKTRECIPCRVNRFPNLRIANTFLTTISNTPMFGCFLCKTAKPLDEDGYESWKTLDRADLDATLVKDAVIIPHKFCRSCFENRMQLAKLEDESYEELIRMFEKRFPGLGKLGATDDEMKEVQAEEKKKAEEALEKVQDELKRRKAVADRLEGRIVIEEPVVQEQGIVGKCFNAAANVVRSLWGGNQAGQDVAKRDFADDVEGSCHPQPVAVDGDEDEFDTNAVDDAAMVDAFEQGGPSSYPTAADKASTQVQNTEEDVKMPDAQETAVPVDPRLIFGF